MINEVRKVLSLGIRFAGATQREVRKEVNSLVKKHIINPEEGRKLLKALLKEALAEQKRVAAFVKQEARQEFKKAKPLLKKLTKTQAKKTKRKKRR